MKPSKEGDDMKVIGITGGIGSGKSTILEYLAREHQARVIQADEVGHFLTWPSRPCYHKVVEVFGEKILNRDGSINRKALGNIVFFDKEKLQKLNHIIHPAVKEYIKGEIKYEKILATRYFIIEAALLIEDEYQKLCDELWYVYADKEERIERLMAERGYSKEKSIRILDNQLTEEEYRAHTDFEIDNSKDIALAYLQIERRMRDYETL